MKTPYKRESHYYIPHRKMSKLILLFLISFQVFFVIKYDCLGQQSITWQRVYGGPFDDNGWDVCKADNGNFFIVGSTPGQGFGYRIYVLKINPYGDTLWTKILLYAQQANAVISSNDGGCVFTGGSSPFTIKLDANGNVVWWQSYGSCCLNCWDIIRTTDRGYIACGEQINTNRDGYIFKVDSLGNLQWQRTYPSLFAKCFYSIEQSSDGGYVAVGYVDDAYIGDTVKALIIKIDSNGIVKWEKRYILIRGAAAKSIIKVSDGYFIAGETGFKIQNYLWSYPFFMRINLMGDTQYVKMFPNEVPSWNITLNIINTNRYIIGCGIDSMTFQYGRLIITDSLGTTIRHKTFASGNYLEICSILPIQNGDILSVGIIDNGTNTFQDIYALRTDSMLNAPPLSIVSTNTNFPTETKLLPNSPNPFNPITFIHFQISKPENIKIIIFDISGKQIAILFDDFIKPGEYKLKWEAFNFSSGIYFCILNVVNKYSLTQKLVLLK